MSQSSNTYKTNGISQVLSAVVDSVSDTGAAFATTKSGEGIFINKRIVEKMMLNDLDEIRAYVVPNYPDMADRIAWRATRVDIQGPSMLAGEPSEVPNDIRLRALMARPDKIVKELWEFGDLCDELGEEEQVVHDLLEKLIADGIVEQVETFVLTPKGFTGYVE